jgi:penicillin amidase
MTATLVDAAADDAPEPKRKRRWLRRILWTILVVAVVVVVVAVGFGRYSVRRAFPQVDGTIEVPGLTAQVEVVRDSWGVPHIYADTTADLMMAQGYVHAQDRFFQMDFWRHISYGELSSMFGDGQVETDTFLRAMDWGGLAEQQYAEESPENRDMLDAYAAGVNAYLETQ